MPITSNRVNVYGHRPPTTGNFMDMVDNKNLSREDRIKLLTEQSILATGFTKEEYDFVIEFIMSLNKEILDMLRSLDRFIIDSIKEKLFKLIKGGLDVIGETLGVKALITSIMRTLYLRQGITSITNNNAFMVSLQRFMIASSIMELIDRGETRAYSVLAEASGKGIVDNRTISLAMDYILKNKETSTNNLKIVMDLIGNPKTKSVISYIPDITERIVDYITTENSETGSVSKLIDSLNGVTGKDDYLSYLSNPSIVEGVREDLKNDIPVIDYTAKGKELNTKQLIAVLGSNPVNDLSDTMCPITTSGV